MSRRRHWLIFIAIVAFLYFGTGGSLPIPLSIRASLAPAAEPNVNIPAEQPVAVVPTSIPATALPPTAVASPPIQPVAGSEPSSGRQLVIFSSGLISVVLGFFALCVLAVIVIGWIRYNKQRSVVAADSQGGSLSKHRQSGKPATSPGWSNASAIMPLQAAHSPVSLAATNGLILDMPASSQIHNQPSVNDSGVSAGRAQRILEPPMQEAIQTTSLLRPTYNRPQEWTCLSPADAMHASERLGLVPRPQDILDEFVRTRRLFELQKRFGATTLEFAPDWSLAVFRNVWLPLAELERIAAPQPVVLEVVGQQQTAVIVGLFHKPMAQAQAPTVADPVPLELVVPAEPRKRSWADVDRPARISVELPLSIEALLSQVVCILGQRRTGKSYTLGVVAEELGNHRIPFALLDIAGEFYGLRTTFNVIIVGKSKTTDVDVNVEPAQACELARWAYTQSQQLVIDISGYTEDERVEFVRLFCEGLWDVASSADVLKSFMLLLDEAHNWYPQSARPATYKSVNRLVIEAGKYGIGVVLATVRPADLSATGRTQAGIALLHRVEHELDIKAYASILPIGWPVTRIAEELQRFGSGTVLAKLTLNDEPTQVQVVKIRARKTPHLGGSPGLTPQPRPKLELLAIDSGVLHELQQGIRIQPTDHSSTIGTNTGESVQPPTTLQLAGDGQLKQESSTQTSMVVTQPLEQEDLPAIQPGTGALSENDPIRQALSRVDGVEPGDADKLARALDYYNRKTDGKRKIEGVSAAVESAWNVSRGGGATFQRGKKLLETALQLNPSQALAA